MAGLVLAVVLCLCGSLTGYGVEAEYQRQNRDPYMIAAQFSRLYPVASTVPEQEAMGYLTDAQPGGVTDSAMRIAAQFVLAPRLFVHGEASEWVLGNFTRPADFAAVGRLHGLTLQRDYGNGVVLFRRDAKR